MLGRQGLKGLAHIFDGGAAQGDLQSSGQLWSRSSSG
jgi:hypothetical protein